MSNHGYPRLCGGTFFTLTLQALKQRMGAREHYNSESDGMSDPEVLMGLFKVVNPDFQELDKKKLKGAADGFKSCKSKSSVYLPFGDTQEIRAFDKRKVDVTDLDRITTEIEQTIQNTLEREISTDKIGEMVMERLKPLDEVAYIRFASIYHRFQDAGSFMREISKFLEEK